MPLDPFADIARRAWFRCPECGQGRDCAPCQAGTNCPLHWQYLLSNRATLLELQCPECAHLWSLDTAK